jgi:hypothetical protein
MAGEGTNMRSRFAISILLGLASFQSDAASAQNCAALKDNDARLRCYDDAPKQKSITPKSVLSPAGKACVLSASQKLNRLPDLKIISSRAVPEGCSLRNAECMNVEINAQAAGQKSTFLFYCIIDSALGNVQTTSLGVR